MKAPELTELAITWLQGQHPDAFITTELSVAEWGGASVDVAAITTSEIVGVEVKGEGDSPTRLELQGLKYGRVCRSMFLLVTPDGTLADRCAKKRPQGWGDLVVCRDELLGPEPTIEARTDARPQPHLCPMAMCETLWRDELAEVARRAPEVSFTGGRATVSTLRNAIVDALPTPRIHDLMVEALRRRVWQPGKRIIGPTLDAGTICAACNGTGLWQGGRAAQMGLNIQDVTCGHCRGTGKVADG